MKLKGVQWHAPGKETIAVLGFIATEIAAGMILVPKTDAERLYNQACQRALDIIANYRNGAGLFQITRTQKEPK